MKESSAVAQQSDPLLKFLQPQMRSGATPAGEGRSYNPANLATRQMSGCEAVAQGAWEAGVHVVSSYPGSPVTSIVDAFAKLDGVHVTWATNEKVALEISAGVAYSGARALAVMKHVGLNVAADALFNLAYTGVRGALVVVVGDDPGATCSQNEQDSRMLAYAANLPVLEPSDCQDALVFTRMAFDISERYDIPVIVRMTTQLCYGSQKVVVSERTERPVAGGFAGPVEKFLLLPIFVPNRHRALISANERIAAGSEIATLYEEHWPEQHANRDVAGRARPVLDDDGAPQRLRHVLGDDAGVGVHGAAGGQAHDEAGRAGLRFCGGRQR